MQLLDAYKNHYALILGGSSGIGLATARQLAAEGLHLCIVHRDRRQALPEIEDAFEEIRTQTGRQVRTFNINALQADKRESVITQLSEVLGTDARIHALVHCLSRGNLKRMTLQPDIQPDKSALKEMGNDVAAIVSALEKTYHLPEIAREVALSPDDINHTITAMATSLWDWAHSLLQATLFTSDARIIGLTSEGNQRAWPYYAAVSAAKATLESLARSMARELATHGLRTNIVQAGVTDTPSLRMIPGSDALKASAIMRNPFRRLTQPEDVAKAIVLLCTPQAAWINGALIPVDGGERLG